jgi:flagellar motor switch protein FliM
LTLDIETLDLLASGRTPQRRSALMESQSDVIMRKIGFLLFQRMRSNVRLLSCINSVMSHEAALAGLPDVMLAGIAELAPLHGRVIVVVDGDLIGAVVDGMCGATQWGEFQRNELSAMENRIARQVIELTLVGITEVFANLMPLRWSLVQLETTTSMLTIAAEQDWMISTTGIFETPIGMGSIRFIAPYTGFEPLEAKLASQAGMVGSSAAADRVWVSALESLTETVSLELAVEIVRAELPIALFQNIRCGEILPCLVASEAIVVSGGIDLFIAEYGQCDGLVCCAPVMSAADDGQGALRLTENGLPSLIVRPEQRLAGFMAMAENDAAPPDRVAVRLTVELGRVRITLKAFEALCYGDMLVLDQLAGAPMKIFVNGYHLGAGEVVTYGGTKYGVRLLSLAGTAADEMS